MYIYQVKNNKMMKSEEQKHVTKYIECTEWGEGGKEREVSQFRVRHICSSIKNISEYSCTYKLGICQIEHIYI